MKACRLILLGSDSDMLLQCSMRMMLDLNVIVSMSSDKIRYCMFVSLLGCL